MSAVNGYADDSVRGRSNGSEAAVPPVASVYASAPTQFAPEKLALVVAELEVPFDPSVIEWRATNTSKDKARGQIIPYADQRAYTDRLNGLFTPAGWTRKYQVHTSSNFERSKDKKIVAKVFVTCELTIFGIGSHSATGEEWADDENAGTAAEAQSFKRACACFGLGRYLYYFSGIWVDLDDRKRPRETPVLFGWATPKGWREGQRPPREAENQGDAEEKASERKSATVPSRGRQQSSGENRQLVQQIESMEKPLGRGLYRGLLKSVARVWKPADVRETVVLRRLLKHMQGADRGLDRLKSVIEKVGASEVESVLASLKLKSLGQIESLDMLHRLVQTLEAKASR